MERAAFKLSSYHFTKASMNFDIPQNSELDVAFRPKGHYVQHLGTYKLTFDTVIVCQAVHSEVINVSCEAEFTFNDLLKKEEIPSFFFPNSLAILFPYVRAFIGTLSLQANVHPILLPTINLMGLTETLRENTIFDD